MTSWIINRQAIKLPEEDIPALYVQKFDFDAAQTFVKDFSKLESDGSLSDIFIYISSYGGEVFPMMMMIEAIYSSKKRVHLVGMGVAYSAGATLLASGPKGSRWLGPNSYMHIHYAQGLLFGGAQELEHQMEQIRRINDHFIRLIVSNSKLNMSKFKKILKEQNYEWQLTAEEALQYGFVDHIGVPILKKYENWECEV